MAGSSVGTSPTRVTCRSGLSFRAAIAPSRLGETPKSPPIASKAIRMGELFLDFDHCPTHVITAGRTNDVRRNGSLALGAVVKLRRLDGVVAASPTRTALGLSALGSGHDEVNSNCSRHKVAMAK